MPSFPVAPFPSSLVGHRLASVTPQDGARAPSRGLFSYHLPSFEPTGRHPLFFPRPIDHLQLFSDRPAVVSFFLPLIDRWMDPYNQSVFDRSGDPYLTLPFYHPSLGRPFAASPLALFRIAARRPPYHLHTPFCFSFTCVFSPRTPRPILPRLPVFPCAHRPVVSPCTLSPPALTAQPGAFSPDSTNIPCPFGLLCTHLPARDSVVRPIGRAWNAPASTHLVAHPPSPPSFPALSFPSLPRPLSGLLSSFLEDHPYRRVRSATFPPFAVFVSSRS